ncbi:hypothetical protein B0H14DRAFT_3682862 [Mycena olivaceomarginata]|nr:hypothetical protein B0H14DRAFT_3682862 [Mycena olivaceomarginata]
MDENPPPPPPPVTLVRTYRRLIPLTIPSIPPIASNSSSHSPVTPSPSSASTQLSLRAPKRTKFQKMDDVLSTYGFPNLGDFLAVLFQPRIPGEKDLRTKRHRAALGAIMTTYSLPPRFCLITKSPELERRDDYLENPSGTFQLHVAAVIMLEAAVWNGSMLNKTSPPADLIRCTESPVLGAAAAAYVAGVGSESSRTSGLVVEWHPLNVRGGT